MRLHLNGFDNDDSERLVCLTVVVAVLVFTAAAVIAMGLAYQTPATTMTRMLLPSSL